MPTKEVRRFDIGDQVMARWPKSNLYFRGKVLDFNELEYLVKFEDEDDSELAIKYKNVEPLFKRSRSRSLGRGRPKSKSPSRKSPSRKSPSRKSPSRKSTSSKASPSKSQSRTSSSKSPGRKPAAKSPVQKPAAKSTEVESSTTTTTTAAVARERLKALANEEQLANKEELANMKNKESVLNEETFAKKMVAGQSTSITTVRHSARIAAFEKNVTSSDGKSSNSSAVNSIRVDAKSVAKSVQEKNKAVEFMKRLGVCLWMTLKPLPLAILMASLPLVLSFLCTAKKCELRLPETRPKLSTFYDKKAFVIVGGLFVCHLVLALIPIGKVVKSKTGAKIRCNGYLSVISTCIAIGVLLKMEYSLASLYMLFRPFMVAFYLLGTVTSLLLYIKSFYARRDALNPQATTGYYFYDFVYGREVSPKIGSFDLKFFFFRFCLILWILLNCLIVAKDLQSKPGNYSPTLLVSAGIQIFYALDFILFEDSFLTTYEYLNEGMGFLMCVGYLNAPFLITVLTRYSLNHRTELPWYCLVGIVALYLFGYTILRGANSQKHAFRTNPAAPALVHLESLPTSAGKRLLVSGWWGLVRHPNYLGDIIVQISWALICGFSHAIPWLVTAFSLGHLLSRVFIVEKQCRSKYGLAWSSYTTRVPYRVLPKVF